MSEKLPAPDFDAQKYARPNDRWTCGYAAEDKPCRLGPDRRGRCQATAECVPVLEVKPGETKGRWCCKCPGGPCETGPLPDGRCSRPISRCAPVPTLRTRRGQVTWAVVTATVALLLIALGGPWRGQIINPGALSISHSGEAFASLHASTNQPQQACSACHPAGDSGPGGLLNAALRADPGPAQLAALVNFKSGPMTAIDAACQKCHTTHSFHQTTVVENLSCSHCHAEHRGAGPIAPPTDQHCAFCHGDATVMAAAAAKGAKSTQIIHSFAGDHPGFRVHSEQRRDPDTLKFNHALHLGGATMPPLPGGAKLDCAFCHQPDSAGTYMRPVNFENHCRSCHSLQFDPATPDLQLPHGDPDFVSAFLRSLPRQYADLALRSGLTRKEEQDQFAQRKLQQLREQVGTGEALEARIFLSSGTQGPDVSVGTVGGASRALFPGCAYCHEVKSVPGARPQITRPEVRDRRLLHAVFDHSKHATVACVQCHAAPQSKETADLLLPTKESCATCHSPRGGVVDSCTTCHVYHRVPPGGG